MMAGSKEDTEAVTAFFEDMKQRGRTAGDLGWRCGHHQGDRDLLSTRSPPALPGASHAQFGGQAAGDAWPEFKVRAQAAYQAPNRAIARELAAGVVADYGRKYDSAVACFMDDFEACIAHLRFPVAHRRAIRTTNLLERLFVEERRRLKFIPNAFGERAVLKLMFGALIRAAERWRSIKVTEFERRQLAAVKKELDQEYEAMVGLDAKPLKDGNPARKYSNSRT
jgi:putative transposase